MFRIRYAETTIKAIRYIQIFNDAIIGKSFMRTTVASATASLKSHTSSTDILWTISIAFFVYFW